MEILELLNYTNEKLQSGLSTAKIEKELGFGKDTLRKKFKREGYSYNKALKQYVTQENTESYKNITHCNTKSYKKEKTAYNPIVEEKNKENIGDDLEIKLEEFKALSTIEQVNFINSFVDGKKNLGDIGREQFGTHNISNIVDRSEAYWDGAQRRYILIEPKGNIFSQEEIMFIKTLYKQHSLKENINNIEQGEIINRSVRVDKDVMGKFAECCKKNNLKQTNALSIALLDFIEKINQ